MSRIHFTKNADALLRGADRFFVLASDSAFRDGAFLSALPEDLAAVARDLAADTRAGEKGATAVGLTGRATPKRLGVAVLPDRVSRYNAPSRAEAVRAAVAALAGVGQGPLAILARLDDPDHLLPVANAVGRALPLYSAKSEGGNGGTGPAKAALLAVGPGGEALAASARVKAVVEAARDMALLVDTPPSELHPRAFQAAAWKAVQGIPGVTKKALVGDQLVKASLGGLHAVGRAAREAPRLLVLSTPGKAVRKGKGRAPHVALVGKGITFDTGGLSLKVGGAMWGMKADMGGAAAVLGAFCALARVGSPYRLSALLCIAENAIGPDCYKLDDILTFHSGKTVEINNTDAEGRLALGDGVSYAARVLKADVVLDAATLTGAQLVATGKRHAAVVSNDADLERLLVDAGTRSGDLVHPLPFAPEFYKEEFKSNVADMRNSVADRSNAQSSCAAEFVHWHIEDQDVRWGHVDMAGPAFVDRRATGYGVALLEEVVRSL